MKILLPGKKQIYPKELSNYQVYFLSPTHSSKQVEAQFESMKNIKIFEDGPEYFIVSNPIFFDFLEFNSAQEVQDTFYIFKGGGIQNISEEQAKKIFEDVEKEFLQVHEILIYKGLY